MKTSEARLFNKIKTRIMTVMIGTLARVEQYKDLFTEDEYEELRTEILDFGHKQLNIMEQDLDEFTITYKTTYFMPLRRRNDEKD